MTELFDMSGRAALVTGSSKGIGKAIAAAFASAGADVMIASRTGEDLQATAAELRSETGARVETCAVDMTDRVDVARLAEETTTILGRVDVLVNNAGSNEPEPTESITDAAWDRIVELNLTSCMLLTRELVPGMKARGWGRVIYIASIMGVVGAAGRSVYCGTKGALISMAHAQAVELGPHGVTVNCISPGPILTDLPRTMFSEAQRATFAERAALGRWGETVELAGPALLLASDAGAYMTGANVVVDGGVTIKAF